jgi:hypothetical protein
VKVQAGDTANEAEDGMDPVVGAGGLGFTGDQGSEKEPQDGQAKRRHQA